MSNGLAGPALDWGGERETVCTIAAGEQRAWVFSSDPRVARKISQRPDAELLETFSDERGTWSGSMWAIPARAILPLRAPRRVTPEARERGRLLARRRHQRTLPNGDGEARE